MSLADLVSSQEQTPTASVTVDAGVDYDLASWSVRREIATDLPSQVTQVRGQAVADASVTLTAPADAHRGHFSPWRNPTRRTKAPLTLDVGLSGEHVRVFTGQVLADGGDASESGVGPLVLECEDRLNTMRKKVTLPGIGEQMSNGAGGVVRPGISPGWAMDSILRQNGYYTTAPPEPRCLVSVPCQDSIWPELPAATDPSKVWVSSASDEAPLFAAATFGRGLTQAGHEVMFPSGPSLATEDALRIAMVTGPDNVAGYSQVRAQSGTHSLVEVLLDGFATGTGTLGTIAAGVTGPTVTFSHDGGPLVVNLYRFGPTLLAYEIKSTVGGSTVTATGGLTVSSTLFSGANSVVDRLYIGVVKLLTAGIQLGTDVVSPSTTLAHVKGTDLDPSLGAISAVPVGLDGLGAEVLTSIAAAEFGALWMDGAGVPTFRNRDTLRGVGQAPEVVTSHDRLLAGMAWTRDTSSLRSAVEIPVRPARVQTATNETIVAWQSDSVIEVPAKGRVDFIADALGNVGALDGTVTGVDGGDATPNPTIGSYFRNISPAGVYAPVCTVTASLVGPSRISISIRNTADYAVNLAREDGDPALVIRARTLISQAEDSTVTARAENPGLIAEGIADEMTVEANPWRQDIATANIDAGWLAAICSEPLPVLQTVRVVFDPRRELGEVIELVDDSVTGMHSKALITGITMSGEAGSATQELTVRLLPWTFGEFEARTDFATFAEFDTYWGGATFADFDLTPLGRV